MTRKKQLKELAASCGTTSKCPYCDFELEKIPKRKAKCKSCKKSIYPRKEPLSGESRLYREGDLFLLEELEALADGWWKDWYESNKGVLNARKDLAKELKVDEISVSIVDARWRESHTDLADGTEQQDWDKVYSSYESMLRQVQREEHQNKTPLAELVAGFIVTGYGRNSVIGGYTMDNTIGRPQFMLIDNLTTEPGDVYHLIKDTRAAKSYCHLLDTVIKRYKAELNDETELLREVELDINTEVVVELSLSPTHDTDPPKAKETKTSKLWVFIVVIALLGALALST